MFRFPAPCHRPSHPHAWSALLLAAAIVGFSACGGGSASSAADLVAVPTPVIGGIPSAVDDTPPGDVDEPEAADSGPAPEPSPSSPPLAAPASDDERIAAAVAAFETSPLPSETIAFDLIDATVRVDDLVELTVCTWDGQSVFDEVRRVIVDVDETLVGTVTGSSPTAGECVNAALMDSALVFIDRFYDEVDEALADPASFSQRPFAEYLTESSYPGTRDRFAGDVADGLTTVSAVQGRVVPDDLREPVMWRRYLDDAGGMLEMAFCLEMQPESGLYRDGVLIDDRRNDSTNTETVQRIVLLRDPEVAAGWRVDATEGRFWANCNFERSWPDAVNNWKPEPSIWQIWQVDS